jgi:hypothetical protein
MRNQTRQAEEPVMRIFAKARVRLTFKVADVLSRVAREARYASESMCRESTSSTHDPPVPFAAKRSRSERAAADH